MVLVCRQCVWCVVDEGRFQVRDFGEPKSTAYSSAWMPLGLVRRRSRHTIPDEHFRNLRTNDNTSLRRNGFQKKRVRLDQFHEGWRFRESSVEGSIIKTSIDSCCGTALAVMKAGTYSFPTWRLFIILSRQCSLLLPP